MKIAIVNSSGNVGKTTVARHLLAPRMKDAREFAVAASLGIAPDSRIERFRAKDFGRLYEALLRPQSAIVDIAACETPEFLLLMDQFQGSHKVFDYFVVPTVAGRKQQLDTISTIRALAAMGVPAKKIRVVCNFVKHDAVDRLQRQFTELLAYHAKDESFTIHPDAMILDNEVFDQLATEHQSVADLLADKTDYRAKLREAKDVAGKADALIMIEAQWLAQAANENLECVHRTLFS